MKLYELTIQHFKGIDQLTLDFQGKNASIYGDNATGKTTIYDAFLWLLFGKDSTDRKAFEVKPLGEDGKPRQHGVEVSVSAIIEHKGVQRTLRRAYAEKWVRRRGESSEELAGHETTYYVDSVPMGQAQYQAVINSMIPENIFKIITNPYYFGTQLKWQERRSILFEVCGHMSDAQIISGEEELLPLMEAIGDYTVDDYRKVLAARHKNINGELNILPARIDEAARMVCEDVSPDDVATEINTLQTRKEQLQGQMQQADTVELNAKLAKIDAELAGWEGKRSAQEAQQRTAFEEERRRRLQAVYAQMDTAPVVSMRDLAALKQKVATLEAAITQGRTKWTKTDGEEWAGDTACPTCRRPFPAEDIQKAQDAFRLNKAERLAAITEQGRADAAELEQARHELEALTAQTIEAENQRQVLEQQIVAIKREPFAPEAMPGYTQAVDALRQERQKIQDHIKDAEAGVSTDNFGVEVQIAQIDARIQVLRQELARYTQGQQAAARVEELQAQRRTLAEEIEGVERQQYLCERFIRIKAQQVEERVNAHFALARFKLFDEQINGGLADACEVTVGGVPYADLNHAMQVNAGLDVIRTLSGYYGHSAPIFIDNAESVVSLMADGVQTIRLVVSAADKRLRLEIEEGGR